VVPHTKPRTQEIYRLLCRLHLFPALGTTPLTEITREKARALFAEKIASGMKRTTALKVVALLREILNHAVDDGHIPANPATRLSRFYRGHTEAEARPQILPLTEAELTTLLVACQRWYPQHLELIATAAWTGLRQGEILGLQWEDVDFHDLRHTFASLLIGRGESLAYVKEQLGHSSIQITVDLYGHLVPGANRSAVDRLAEATGRNLAATSEEARERDRDVTRDEDWSRRRDLNPRPADYESRAGAKPALSSFRALPYNGSTSQHIRLLIARDIEVLSRQTRTREHIASRGV